MAWMQPGIKHCTCGAAVARLMADIAAASSEQSQGIAEVNRSVTEMDGATQQNAMLIEEAAAAAVALNEQAQRLREVGRYLSHGVMVHSNRASSFHITYSI